MSQIIVEIDDEPQAQNFVNFVKELRFVRLVEVKKNGNGLRNPPQIEFSITPTIAELEALASQFPADFLWTYQKMIDVFPPNTRIEIINNQLYIMPSPTIKHQRTSKKLFRLLDIFVEENELGEVNYAPLDVKFDDGNVVQPDLVFVSEANREIVKDKCIEGAPDMVAEILSKDKKRDLVVKKGLYEQNKVQEYWTVDMDKKEVKISQLEKNKYKVSSQAKEQGKVKSEVIKGFSLDIKSIF